MVSLPLLRVLRRGGRVLPSQRYSMIGLIDCFKVWSDEKGDENCHFLSALVTPYRNPRAKCLRGCHR